MPEALQFLERRSSLVQGHIAYAWALVSTILDRMLSFGRWYWIS